MAILDDCIMFYDNRSNPSVNEEGKSFTLSNTKKLKVKSIKIDGCVYKEEKTKCDYLMIAELNKPKAFFIELKGSDVPYGITQILNTVTLLKNNYSNHILEARLSNLGSTVPNYKERKSYIDLAKIIFPTGGNIVVKKSPFTEPL